MSLPSVDAKSQVSGAFYTWGQAQFDAALQADEDAHALLKALFGIRLRGNAPPGAATHEDFSGKNLIYHTESVPQAAAEAGIPTSAAAAVYRRGLSLLRRSRGLRPRPMVEQKILASWNGYAIAALTRGAVHLDEPALLEKALRAADFLLTHMIDPTTFKIRRSWLNGISDIDGVCDDYAAVIDAFLALHAATGDEQWRERAEMLQQRQMTDFLDPSTGAFFDVARGRTDVFLRLRSEVDADLFSPNALSARNLVRLSKVAVEPQASAWKAAAEKLFQHFNPLMAARSSMTPGLLAAWEELTRP